MIKSYIDLHTPILVKITVQNRPDWSMCAGERKWLIYCKLNKFDSLIKDSYKRTITAVFGKYDDSGTFEVQYSPRPSVSVNIALLR